MLGVTVPPVIYNLSKHPSILKPICTHYFSKFVQGQIMKKQLILINTEGSARGKIRVNFNYKMTLHIYTLLECESYRVLHNIIQIIINQKTYQRYNRFCTYYVDKIRQKQFLSCKFSELFQAKGYRLIVDTP